ncbi:MAG TPA: DUF4097 family beta strand repeat-containing protein [Mycobacteriales bacterium]
MSRTEHFPTPGPVELFVRNAAGTVDVVTTDTGTSTVELAPLDDGGQVRERIERARVEASGDGRRIVVELPDRKGLTGIGRQLRVAVRVAVPPGSALRLHAASAKVTAAGRYADAEVHTASGTVRLGDLTGPAQVHVASGEIEISSCAGGKVHAASGSLSVGRTSDRLDVHTASGDVSIGVAESSLRIRTASGRVTIEEAASGRLELDTASGDQRIGVRRGVTAKLDLVSPGGRVRSELPVEDEAPEGGAGLEIRSRAASGLVLVRPAVPVAG